METSFLPPQSYHTSRFQSMFTRVSEKRRDRNEGTIFFVSLFPGSDHVVFLIPGILFPFLRDPVHLLSATSVGAAGFAVASAICLLRLTRSGHFRFQRMPHRGTVSLAPRSLSRHSWLCCRFSHLLASVDSFGSLSLSANAPPGHRFPRSSDL